MSMRSYRRAVPVAALLAAGAWTSSAGAQIVWRGLARVDQSDVTHVAVTSADLLALERRAGHAFTCPVAYGVRVAADRLERRIALGERLAAAPGAPADGALRADAGDLATVLSGHGGREERTRLAAALAEGGDAGAAGAARALVRSLDGLVALAGRMDPAEPGRAVPARLVASVDAYNHLLDRLPETRLAPPAAELAGVHAVLGALVESAVENRWNPETPAPAGGLACGPLAVAPRPPAAAMVEICVVHGGRVREVTARVDPETGDTTFAGRPLAEAFAGEGPYAGERAFFAAQEPVALNGRQYVRSGIPRTLGEREALPAGEVMGIPAFTVGSGAGVPEVLFLPVGPGCVFQPYQLQEAAAAVRG
jgi:hypothetical protein